MATAIFMAMARSKLLTFLLSLNILTLCVSGQDFNVSIMVDPNMTSYTVGNTLMFTCMVVPMLAATNVTVTYSWECSGCFAEGRAPAFSQVLTDMDTSMIICSATINGITNRSDVFDLQVTQAPPPLVTLNPNPAQPAMVGSRQTIECRVGTVLGVSSVMISWTGPGGVSIMNNSRMSISPTTSNGNVFTSNLRFEYLMEGDEGNYTCSWMILENSGSMSVEIQSLAVPPPNVTVTAPNNQTVGQSLTLQCEVTAVRGITSGVDIVWSSGGTVLQRIENVSSAMMSNSLVYTNSYTISQLNTTDDGRMIQCQVVINTSPPVMASNSITLDVTVPTPMVTISPSGPILRAMVGSPQVINCTVSTVSGVQSSSVMISWMGPRGNITNDTTVTINPTTSSGNIYTSSLEFEYLAEEDNGTYMCDVTILDTLESESITMSLIIPEPVVSVRFTDTPTLGENLTIECNATVVRGISSRLDFTWRRVNTIVQTVMAANRTIDNSLIYTNDYTTEMPLSETDIGVVYNCTVSLDNEQGTMATNSVTLDESIIPPPIVNVTAPSNQTVGQPLTLQCEVTIVRDITSRVDIVWRDDNGIELQSNNVTAMEDDVSSTMYDSLFYTDSYTISQLNTTDDDRVIQCEVVINTSPPVRANDSITLNVNVPTSPEVIVSPSGSIQEAMVGSPLIINCTVSTVSGVESSSVMISWMEPGGNITNDSRVTISPTTSSGNDYTSSLEFEYLAEGDEGNYTCNVMILDTSESQSVNIIALTIPAPFVNVTAPNTQTVGQSLTLQCLVTAVRGITSRVDIVLREGDRVLERTNDTNATMVYDSLLFTILYTIPLLSTDDQGTGYWCRAEINSSPVVTNDGNITLNVTVPEPSIDIAQSGPRSFSGLDYNLTCTVTVASGVSSSLVRVNWDRQDLTSPSSSISNTSISGSQYTRIITFSPLLKDDGGQYTCSVSVDGFSEADNSNSTMIVVNDPPVTLTIMPLEIIDEDAGGDIELVCEANKVEGISADYSFDWLFNDVPVNQSDARIDIMNSTMNSTITISNSRGNDSGNYTCQLTLTVANMDNFIFSETEIVALRAMEPPLVPVVTNIVTTPYSANISWIVRSIVNDTETYTVLYGNDTMGLTSSSEVVEGNSDLSAINEMFTVDIGGLMPFTTYYFIVSANNSVGTTNTSVMTFRTNETAPDEAPGNLRSINVTATSITFQWDQLPVADANGLITSYTLTCTRRNSMDTFSNTFNDTMGTIAGLAPFTEYGCTVLATTVSPGPMSTPPTIVTTLQSAPNPPVINAVVSINSSAVRVNWTRPNITNGIITIYTITYVVDGNVNGMSVNVSHIGEQTQSYDIIGLSPYQLVTVNITATNGGGTSNRSNEVSGRSSEAAPGVVQMVQTNGSLVTWEAPMVLNGIITGYEVSYFIHDREDVFGNSSRLPNSTTSFDIQNLIDGTPYDVTIVAFTSAGEGPPSDRVTFFSRELPPNRTVDLSTVSTMQLNNTSINVTWQGLTLFEAQGFPVYNVTIVLMTDNNRKRRQSSSDNFIIFITGDTFAVFVNLVPDGSYSLGIGVRSSGVPIAEQDFVMSPGSIDIMVSPPITATSPTPASTPASIPASTPTSIPASTPMSTPTTTPSPTTPSPGQADDDDGANGGAIAGGVIAAIVAATVIVVIVVIIVLRMRRTRSYTVVKATDSEGAIVNKRVVSPTDSDTAGDIALHNIDPKLEQRLEPIPLNKFSEHVANMHKDRDLGFEEEYSTISTETQASYDISQLSANIIKNRYANIFPYDFSRVKISQVDLKDDDTDYINATLIDGYNRTGAYIAAQGPLPETVKDFWQMVWDQKSPTIVMVTKTIEADVQKCEQYWPDKVGESIQPKPSLSVTLTQIQHFADYELRTMAVAKVSENEKDESNVPLEVKHFFFTSWPDHGVPQFATALISFIKRIRQCQPKDGKAPLIVHCSAGVGRTGTYITLDTMLERIQDVDNVSVYECVRNLRARRVFMVQTQAQYIFIHDALEELITCGDTSFNVQSMRVKVNRMGKVNPDTEITGFQQQFQLLEKVSRKPTATDRSDAQHSANKSKNRFENTLPYDASRVILKAALNQPGTDYINASRIDGYKERHAFIAAQCPLDNTIGDFWRMIWENKSAVIVLLCDPKHDEKNFTQFWPADSEEHGPIKVTQKSQAEKNGYLQYKFSVMGPPLSVGLEPEPLTVTMLHYANWPDEEKPNDNAGLLAVIKDALELQRNTGNRAMTVMCSDGCGRSGTFIAIYYTIERLKVEGVVDIFQAIKNSRLNRVNLVSNAKQYESCHEVVLEFLDEFEQYANFK